MKKRQPYLFTLLLLFLTSFSTTWAQEGVFNINGNLTLAGTATYEAQLKDLSGAGNGHDQINVTGDLTLSGTLDLALNGYTPNVNDLFEIMAYSGTLSGNFTTINWPAAMVSQGWTIDYGVLSSGKVTIYGPSSMLPVDLLFFKGEQQGGEHLLSWKTASEINSAYFSVEHSSTGIDFRPVGEVLSQGNSDTIHSYHFSYSPPSEGLHYYRLRQVDLDGRFEYSSVISIRGMENNAISIQGNPTKALLQLTKPVSGVVIYDLQGTEVFRSKEGNDHYDISALAAGLYLVEIGDARSLRKLIIHQ